MENIFTEIGGAPVIEVKDVNVCLMKQIVPGFEPNWDICCECSMRDVLCGAYDRYREGLWTVIKKAISHKFHPDKEHRDAKSAQINTDFFKK